MSWVEDMRLCGENCVKCSHNGRSDCRIMFLALAWELTRKGKGARGPRRSLAIAALRAILAKEPDMFGFREIGLEEIAEHGGREWGRGGGIVAAIRRLEALGVLSVIRSDRIGETNLYEVREPSFASIFGVEYAEMGGDVSVFLSSDIVSDFAAEGG